MEDTPDGTPDGLGGHTVMELTKPEVDEPAAGPPRRHLLVFNGAASWMHQLPAAGRVIIGRSETADLRIDDASVSRQHASVSIEGDTITINDCGSQNGTFVNEVKINGETPLRPSDVIRIQRSTLILHVTPTITAQAAASVLQLPIFRDRVMDEIDRAIRYERNVSVLCLTWQSVKDGVGIARQIADQLRRMDCVSWLNPASLAVMLAEASSDEARTIATRLRARLDKTVRIGYATCPADGYDVDALVSTARSAAIALDAGNIGGSARAFQTLTIGAQRVIVADPAVIRLYALIERLAPVDLSVLVTGETGCGKELAATAIHTQSHRRTRQMVSLNCAAMQETLVESELFGREKGAFSGAMTTKAGLIEAATESTLFLDEVGELSLPIQAKLLRVLETQRVTRVGDVREREVNVRIVAATNRDLEEDVAAGRFRQDLYFRLSAATLHIPPLRERPRELPLLAEAFLAEACARNSRSQMTIAPEAMEELLKYPWPGNVRELKNLMRYVAAAHPETVLTQEHVLERLTSARAAAGSRSSKVTAITTAVANFRPLSEEPSVRRAHLRVRRRGGGWPVLDRDGDGAWHHARPLALHAWAAADRSARAILRAHRRGRPLRARARHRASRSEALEHHGDRARRPAVAEAARSWHREGRRRRRRG